MAMDDCAAHPDDEVMHDEHCAVFAIVPEDDATHISVSNGSWFSASTWNTGTVPNAGANVLIDSGFIISYDAVSETEINWVRVEGTLNFASDINTKLKVTTFVVDPTGYVNIGTAAAPIASNVTAKIMFSDQGPIDISMDPYEFGKGLISHGFFTANGYYKKPYCAITKQLNAGVTKLKLSETPTGWQVGDVIIMPGTNATVYGDFDDNTKFHDEELTITSISGKTIYFTNNANGSNSLLYEHKMPAGYGLKMYVANTTRNIEFASENYTTIPTNQRGHVMLMHNVGASIKNASFIGLGRTDKNILVTDPVVDSLGNQLSGGENVRGRYACHVHRAGTNNIAVVPVLISGCVVWDATSWGFVNHASNVNCDDNIVYGFGGAAFVTEDGNELGSFRRDMAIKGLRASLVTDIIARTSNFDFGSEGNGFWLQGVNVSYESDIAVSCSGDAYKIFSDDASMPAEHQLKIPKANILNPIICGIDDSIYTAVVPMRQFKSCVAYNCMSGMAFWTHLFNSDNIGDFSTVQYDPYTHTIMSVVEDFKFWNLLSAGISVKYSGQVEFKNGLLLGDITNQYAGSGWITGNPYGGYAFITSTVTGQINYNNLTVKGWKRALIAGRSDDLQSGDENEYNYRTSKVIGGIYNNNTYNIWPEEGTDIYGASEYFKFPKYFEISGAPSFTAITANVLPVADFSYAAIGGNGIKFNGSLSSDSDPGIITPGAGNGIAAYTWTFGDGATGTGVDPVHNYLLPGTYSATLTVYDSQGKTTSVSKNIYVATAQYSNTMLNSGFETGTMEDVPLTNNARLNVDAGWLKKGEWQIVDGKATIYNSDKWERPLIQIVKNDHALQGTVEFSFQAKNTGLGAASNPLVAEVIGVNGEFVDPDVKIENNIQKWANNDLTFSKTLLYSHNYGTSSFNWQTFSTNINFGSGYDYIVVKYYSTGVKIGPGEIQGIDNVCLPCNCQTPAKLFEDELTPTHAMLIWDNVGSEQYQLQYKTTTGGAWTTVTVENTFYELSSLTANTSYSWQVKALCDGVWTAYSTERIFITPSAGTSCTSPTILSTTLITATKATCNWNSIPGATQYQVSYKKLTGATWTTVNTTSTYYQLSGLSALTAYQWKVKAECAAGWKNFTSVIDFITLPLKEEGTYQQTSESISIYPNPVSDHISIVFNEPADLYQIKITDVTGRLIKETVAPGAGNSTIQIDLNGVPVGIYFLTVSGSGTIYETKKFVKQ